MTKQTWAEWCRENFYSPEPVTDYKKSEAAKDGQLGDRKYPIDELSLEDLAWNARSWSRHGGKRMAEALRGFAEYKFGKEAAVLAFATEKAALKGSGP